MDIKQIIVGPLRTNCYLLINNNELAVIDPGAEPEKILKQINMSKAKVKYIINTHFHYDHILGNRKIKKKTGAKVLIHEAEKDFIDFIPERALKDGDKIKIGSISLKVVHTPGHSAGGICLFGNGFVFTGDTLFKNAYGRVDLPTSSSEDMEKSLKKLSNLIKPGTTVYPGHGQIFKT